MGVFLSRLWTQIAHLMGWHVPRTHDASQNVLRRQPDPTRVDSDDEMMADASSDFISSQGSETGETSLRRRIRKTPERGSDDRDSEPPSPRKSNWEEGAEHPKPKLDAVPPTKKTKEDVKEKNYTTEQVEATRFDSFPNVQFGSEGFPESLVIDCTANISAYAELMNGHADDTPSEHPHLLRSGGAEPDMPTEDEDALQSNLQPINQDAEIRGKNAGGKGEGLDNHLTQILEEESEMLGDAGEGIENSEKEAAEPPSISRPLMILQEEASAVGYEADTDSENLNLSSKVENGSEECQDAVEIDLPEGAEIQDPPPEMPQEESEHLDYHSRETDAEDDLEEQNCASVLFNEESKHLDYHSRETDAEDDLEEQNCASVLFNKDPEHQDILMHDSDEMASHEDTGRVDAAPELVQENQEHPCYKIDDNEKMDSEEEAEKTKDSSGLPNETPEHPCYKIDDNEKMDSEEEAEKTKDSSEIPKESQEHPCYNDDIEKMDSEEEAEKTKDSSELPKESQEHPCYQTDDDTKKADDCPELPQEMPDSGILQEEEQDIEGNTGILREEEQDIEGNTGILQEEEQDIEGNTGILQEEEQDIEGNTGILQEEEQDIEGNTSMVLEARSICSSLVDSPVVTAAEVALDALEIPQGVVNELDVDSQEQQDKDLLQGESGEEVEQQNNTTEVVVHALRDAEQDGASLEYEIQVKPTDFESGERSTELISDGADAVVSSNHGAVASSSDAAEFSTEKNTLQTELILQENAEVQNFSAENTADYVASSSQEAVASSSHAAVASSSDAAVGAEFSTEKNAFQAEEIIQENAEVQNFSAENTEHIDPILAQKFHTDIKKSKQVNVQWNGLAGEVFITGSWLNWDGRVRLEKSDENVWSADVEFDQSLEEIELKFIVDGVWLTSPDMLSVDDGFGNRNNIIKLMH